MCSLVGSNGGLGGLLSMIIPRTTETRTHDEIEAELEALSEAEEEAATEEPLDLPAPDPAAGPILATKGKAAAAPPTDPSALAYDHGAGLQSVQTQSVTFENSPLAGQGAHSAGCSSGSVAQGLGQPIGSSWPATHSPIGLSSVARWWP